MLGSNLALIAHEELALEVVGVDLVAGLAQPGVETLILDLSDEPLVQEILGSKRPSLIIHCAAMTDVDRCQAEPASADELNVGVTSILARCARELDIQMVYISTDAVFEGIEGGYSEDDTPAPVNIYAESKLAGELAVMAESAGNLVIRTNIYGWNLVNKSSLAEWILGKLEAGEHVPGFTDVFFTPILANDLSDALFELVEQHACGVLHVAGSQACSKFDFATMLAEVFGLETSLVEPVSIHDSQLKAPRPVNTTLNIDKASQWLERTLPDVRTGLARFRELRDSGFLGRLRASQGRT